MTHMCDSVNDELMSLVVEMQKVFKNIVEMNQQDDKTNIEQYCQKNKKMIQCILQYVESSQHTQKDGPKHDDFRTIVTPFIQ
uniref:Uncharacterized protein n=1 Tax=viral metagenome TaxID=1070528 RepID=A0A6C0KIN1_9ZZZZ